MKLTENVWLRSAVRVGLCMAMMCLAGMAPAQAVSTTTVQGTVYLANGQAGGGTLVVSWPTFTTAAGQLVAADKLTVTIPADGFVSVNLAPNQGATPAGEYYTAVFYMSDGTVHTQYWVVPAAAQASLAQVQTQVMPAAQAVQAVSKTYVDQTVAQALSSQITVSGGNLTGPLYLSGDPTQPLQAADKHYVDQSVAQAVPLAGGSMTGGLTTPAVNGVQAPAAGSAQTTLQAAVNAAGTNGAVEIPPTYAGTDRFVNANGVRVTDLRTNGGQQTARNVKEFGAVCDGTTDDTSALQAALTYANAHGVALMLPQGICKTRTLSWHGESIGGLGKQVSGLMGFPGQDVLASMADSTVLLKNTQIHDLTIYVDQSVDESCSPAEGRAPAGGCNLGRPMESNSIFSPGGNGLTGSEGAGAGWSVGNCAIAMPAQTGAGGNGLQNAVIENVAIMATGTDPMAVQYPGAHSTHTCGMYLGQWPQWSEFRNIDIRGVNTGIAIPALPGIAPAGLSSDSNRWQNITIQAVHAFTAAAGSNDVLDNVATVVGNSAAMAEPPTGIVLDLPAGQQGWTVRNAVVQPAWNAVQPQLTVTAAGGAVTGVAVGAEHGLGFDPYGTQIPVAFSTGCTAQATASVNGDGSIGSVAVTQGGTGCSATTTASVNEPGTWDTAAPVNLIGGQDMSLFGGNLLKGNGGYTVWNATGSQNYGTQLAGGGGNLPGGGTYAGLVANSAAGSTYAVDQFPGADFGAKLQACVNAINPTYGGTCDARNFTGALSMGSNLTISTANTTVELPCATIATANSVVVTAGTRNVSLRGCALRGGSAANGNLGGTVFQYSGTGPMVQVGDPAYLVDTPGFHLDNMAINTTGATSTSAEGLAAYRTQEMDIESVYFLGNQNQTGMTLDGTGNYTGGTFFDNAFNGFVTAVNAMGHQVANSATTDWLNASTFVRLHIVCPTSGGYPIAGTTGFNLQQGDGNTFTGGDVEGCATALHLGPNAQNNTILGLRNENSTNQVVADAGSAYNNWITGGTMFTGKLSDSGTRNSFLDTFHRSFNGMNGDWYGSQQDATITNHYRLGTGTGSERGLLNRFQTDYGYRWTTGLTDATSGEQFYQVRDELNNVDRVSVGQYLTATANTVTNVMVNNGGCYSSNAAPVVSLSGGGGSGAAATAVMGTSKCSGGWQVASVTMTSNGSGYTSQPAIAFAGGSQISAPSAVAEISTAGSTNNQTVLNSTGTGAVVLNGSNNAGTGGVVFGSGGPNETTVATINNAGNAQFNGTLQVSGTSTFNATTTVKNQADAEIDTILQAGLSAPQKESLIYRDWNGSSQWYMVKDTNNNWALNSATGNLDSFKAYQSTNSGDTYINAAKSSGVVRVNYETGAGTAFNIYGGSSSSLYASFSGTNAIKFPGLAAASGVDCLQVDNSGYISNTGVPCGSGSGGGSGTVESGLTGQIAYYPGNGTAVGGINAIPVSAGGTGATTAADALANLLPGAIADGNNGVTVSGNVTQNASIPKTSPYADVRSYGAKIDGATDIGSAMSSAVASQCRSSGTDGSACQVLLPCGGSGCYLANGSSMVGTSNGQILNIVQQGTLSLGSTLVIPDRTTWQCAGGGGNTQFQYKGASCDIKAPNVNGTLGTAVTTTGSAVTFTPTYTNGSSANFHVNSAITVAGVQTCSASASRTSAAGGPNTIFTLSGCTDSSGHSEGPRTPVGSLITVSGCSDASFNITSAPVNGQDWPNGIEQIYEPGATATASGCTVTGFDENTYETVSISAVAGGTMTATFAHSHAASDLFGMVAVTFASGNFNHHDLQDVSIGYNKGVGLWLDNIANINLDGVGVGASATITSAPLECDGCWQGNWNALAVIASAPFQCTSNCTAGYPYSLRCSQDAKRNNGIGCQFLQVANSTFIGGIKVDGNGMSSSQGVGPQIGPLVNDVFEQTGLAAVAVDPRYGMGGQVSVSMNYSELQDDFMGNIQVYVAGTDCCVYGFADMGDLTSFEAGAVLNNKYWPNRIIAKNLQTGVNPASIGMSTGVLSDGDTIIGNYRGQDAGLSPAVIPTGTLAVTANPTCSTCSSATGPDGAPSSALEIQSISTGSNAVAVGTTSQSTYAGDWIIFGSHLAPGTNNTYSPGDAQWGLNAAYSITTSGTDTFVGGKYNGAVATGGALIPLSKDSWQPGITLVQLATGQTAAHTLTFRLYSPGPVVNGSFVSGVGERFYDWFWVYIPGPNNPAYTGVTQQEVVRWMEELYHGYVPSGLAAGGGTLAMDPNHKLSWGTTTNLYRGPNNSVKTDQAFDAVQGYKCNGSYGANGQFLQSTGSGCQWANSSGSVPQVPAWLLYQGDGSGGAFNCTSGTCYLNGDNWFSSVNISAGATVVAQYYGLANFYDSPLIIRSTGSCTVAGSISASAAQTNGITGSTVGGGGGGGGGGGSAAGASGQGNQIAGSGGSAGAASGGTGGSGGTFATAFAQQIVAAGAFNTLAATPLGGAGGGAGGSGGGAAGKGGGAVVLDCQSINFTGTVDVSGSAGASASANNTGAGGGGGGGFVILRAPNWTANSGSINVSGGAGGSCGAYTGCGAGGSGANGWSKVFTQ